jgi:hypothetical protein
MNSFKSWLVSNKMTDYYNLTEINSRHAVAFDKPKEDKDQFYYDFDREEWRQVTPLANLPYGLCAYRFIDEEDEDKCVVTCHDSYRLSTSSNPILHNHEMVYHKEWRDAITIDSELEYMDSSDVVQYAKVIRIKSDIIPGVIVCGPRKHPNVNCYGYIYKESSRFSKIGKHLPIISEDTLTKERLDKDANINRCKIKNMRIAALKKSMDYITCKKYENHSNKYVTAYVTAYDTRAWFRGLDHHEPMCSKKYLTELLEKNSDICADLDDLEVDKLKEGFQVCIVTMIVLERINGTVPSTTSYASEAIPEKSEFDIRGYVNLQSSGGDFVYDINVRGASYAYLWSGDADPYNEHNRRIDLEKVNDVFTFVTTTLTNPIHTSITGARLFIYTDGDLVTWKTGIIDGNVRNIFHGFGNTCAVSNVADRILFHGHMWSPSFSFHRDDLVKLKKCIE